MSDENGETARSIYWRYQDARSNKDYTTTLKPAEGGLWIASYAYGPHGGNMTLGTKMSKGPGTYAQALKVFGSMVKERTGKGYVAQGGPGLDYVAAPQGQRLSGVQCQLLNAVSDEEAEAKLDDPGWFCQQKHDGKRMLIRSSGSAVEGINRKGLLVSFPKAVQDAAAALPADFIIDGEAVRGRLLAFDLLEVGGRDIRGLPARERLNALERLIGREPGGAIEFVAPAFSSADKKSLYDRLLAENREGIVFKRCDAPYVAGRPNSGGNQLKRKFYETCSAVVEAVNDQRSVELRILKSEGGNREWRPLGSCTIPSNHDIPDPGDVVEIRYRKANETGGLQEPVYLGVRTDIEPEECLVSQLVFRPS